MKGIFHHWNSCQYKFLIIKIQILIIKSARAILKTNFCQKSEIPLFFLFFLRNFYEGIKTAKKKERKILRGKRWFRGEGFKQAIKKRGIGFYFYPLLGRGPGLLEFSFEEGRKPPSIHEGNK